MESLLATFAQRRAEAFSIAAASSCCQSALTELSSVLTTAYPDRSSADSAAKCVELLLEEHSLLLDATTASAEANDDAVRAAIAERSRACLVVMLGIVVSYFSSAVDVDTRLGLIVFLGPFGTTESDVLLAAVASAVKCILVDTVQVLWNDTTPPSPSIGEYEAMLLSEIENLLVALSDALSSSAAAEQMVTISGVAVSLRQIAEATAAKDRLPGETLKVFEVSVRGLTRAAFGTSSTSASSFRNVTATQQMTLLARRLQGPSFQHLATVFLESLQTALEGGGLPTVTHSVGREWHKAVQSFSTHTDATLLLSAVQRQALVAAEDQFHVYSSSSGSRSSTRLPLLQPIDEGIAAPAATALAPPPSGHLLRAAVEGPYVVQQVRFREGAEEDDDRTPNSAALNDNSDLLSSVGLLPLSELVSVVVFSLQSMPVQTKELLRAAHLKGLTEMQWRAAKECQRLELERIAAQAAQDIEDVPAHKLYQRARGGGVQPLKEAAAQLARSGLKGTLQKRAFRSVLVGFEALKLHSMTAASVRPADALHLEALVARVFAQLPYSAFDSVSDMLLEYVRGELKDPKLTLAVSSSTLSDSPTTSFLSLSVQVLFMLFGLLSTEEATEMQQLGGGGGGSVRGGGAQEQDGAAGSQTWTSSEMRIDVQEILGWLHHSTSAAAGVPSSSSHNLAGSSSSSSNNDHGLVISDSPQSPSHYSHFLCRLIGLCMEHNRVDVLVELLQQAPSLTQAVWAYLLVNLCLPPLTAGDQGQRLVSVGIVAIAHLAIKRQACALRSICVLLHVATSRRSDARRLAVLQLSKLLDVPDVAKLYGHVVTAYAKQSLRELSSVTTLSPSDATTMQLTLQVDSCLMLTAMLCSKPALQAHGLLPDLFTQFGQWPNNVQRVVLAHPDLSKLFSVLFLRDMDHAIFQTFPSFRASLASGAVQLVALFVRVAGAELYRQLGAVEQEKYPHGVPGAPGGPPAKRRRDAHPADDAPQELQELLTRCYDAASHALHLLKVCPVAEQGLEIVLPLCGALSKQDLIETVVPALLERARVADDAAELQSALAAIIRRMPSNVALLLQQQQQHQQSAPHNNKPSSSGTGKSTDGVANSSQGILPTVVSSAAGATAAAANQSAEPKGPAASSVRGISPSDLLVAVHLEAQQLYTQSADSAAGQRSITKMFRNVIDAALSATSPEDLSVLLFPSATISRSLKVLMTSRPLPHHLMMTCLMVARVHPELVHTVVSQLLPVLAREAVWHADPGLWRGALMFSNEHRAASQAFLLGLPEAVLVEAAKAIPDLMEVVQDHRGLIFDKLTS